MTDPKSKQHSNTTEPAKLLLSTNEAKNEGIEYEPASNQALLP